MCSNNPYIPMPVEIIKIIDEVDTHDIKSFRLKFLNQEDEARFKYLPGQFSELSIYGRGESPIGIASSLAIPMVLPTNMPITLCRSIERKPSAHTIPPRFAE